MDDAENQVKTEARGAHAVAWLGDASRAELPAPIVMVGLNQEEAAEHLKAWLAARRARATRPGA